jgi:DNA-binding transcriptional LysR family regulator
MAQVDLNDVALFVRVVDRGGFAKAAREERVPTSTVSRAVSRLEASVGAQLLVRSTRTVLPTAEGKAFYAEVAPAISALHHAARGVDGADKKPRGKLRVTAPNDIGAMFLGEVVAQFSVRYPHVEVETLLTQRHANLVEEGIDVALRAAGRLPDSTLVARKIGDLGMALYASPEYLRSHGAPESLEALEAHQCVLFRASDGKVDWLLFDEVDRVAVPLTMRGKVTADDFLFVRSAVLAGAGIGFLPDIVVAADLQAERLVRVLPRYAARGSSLYFLHVAAANVSTRIVAFREFVVEAFAKGCGQKAPARPR